MSITRKAAMVLGVVGSLAMTATAGAQTGATFSTTGYFTGALGSAICSPNTFPGAPTASCTSSGFELDFTGASADNFLGTVSLGTFNLSGTGLGGTVPNGSVLFNLVISQTNPSVGNGTFSGNISGHIETAPPGDVNSSTLVFIPDQHMVTIGGATYTLTHDSYDIPFNTSSTNNTINANVTTTPEPGSLALLGTGLIGLVPMVRRRRK